ncbi:MAG: hypothetical protein ACR2GQ_01725 [Gemmatimonadota bacterium]
MTRGRRASRPSLERRTAQIDSTLDALRRIARLPDRLQHRWRYDRALTSGTTWGRRLGGALSVGVVAFGVGLALYAVFGQPEE